LYHSVLYKPTNDNVSVLLQFIYTASTSVKEFWKLVNIWVNHGVGYTAP